MAILQEAAEILKGRLGDEYPRLTLERLVTGLFFTGVKLSDGSGGLCFTPIKEIPEAVCCPSSAGRVFDPRRTKGMGVEEVLRALSSPEPIKVAVPWLHSTPFTPPVSRGDSRGITIWSWGSTPRTGST